MKLTIHKSGKIEIEGPSFQKIFALYERIIESQVLAEELTHPDKTLVTSVPDGWTYYGFKPLIHPAWGESLEDIGCYEDGRWLLTQRSGLVDGKHYILRAGSQLELLNRSVPLP